MIRHPNAIRGILNRDIEEMFRHVRMWLTMYADNEVDVMLALERPQVAELQIELTNFLMAKFGHETKPKEPRFDKTRRRLAKKTPKGPRGVPKSQQPQVEAT